MAFARIGPLTTVLEDAATAMGAGAVAGSIAIGVAGLLMGWPRGVLEQRALSDGYVGAGIGILFAAIDIALRNLL